MPTNVQYPNLPNAPIEEAIISLTIKKHKHASSEAAEAACQPLATLYPNKKPWRGFEAAFEISTDGVNTSHRELNQGFVLSSDDQKTLLHISRDILSLNRLRPYGSWKKFSSDYKHAWDVYTSSLTVENISNLTIRYINSFTIPTPEWEQYLLMRPVLQSSSAIDPSIMAMGEVFSRYVLASESHMAQAIVLLNIRLENPSNLRVIMDIEVHSKTGISDYPGYHAIIDNLNRLRDFKNQIFFSNLPKAEEQFS